MGIPLFDWNWWHGHEMIFGFAAPAIVGFLLTAAQNWTGVPTLSGKPLAILFGVWLLGRLLMWFSQVVDIRLIAAVDIAFLVLSAIALAIPLVVAKNWRNLIFVAILLMLAGANGMSYLWAELGQRLLVSQSLLGAVFWVVTVVAIMGGRVIPFFTAKRLSISQRLPFAGIESVSLGALIVIAFIYTLGLAPLLPPFVLGGLFGAATVAHAIRLSRWQGHLSLGVPLLWSLHLAYGFLVLGLAMMTLHTLDLVVSITAAFHLLTMGGIGLLVLAMMTRVSLGHTGRPLKVDRWVIFAYISVALSALVRVGGPMVFPMAWVPTLYAASAVFWATGFMAFTIKYAPVLWQRHQKQ